MRKTGVIGIVLLLAGLGSARGQEIPKPLHRLGVNRAGLCIEVPAFQRKKGERRHGSSNAGSRRSLVSRTAYQN